MCKKLFETITFSHFSIHPLLLCLLKVSNRHSSKHYSENIYRRNILRININQEMEIFGEAILKIASEQTNNYLHQCKVVVKHIVGLVRLVRNLVQVLHLWDCSSLTSRQYLNWLIPSTSIGRKDLCWSGGKFTPEMPPYVARLNMISSFAVRFLPSACILRSMI